MPYLTDDFYETIKEHAYNSSASLPGSSYNQFYDSVEDRGLFDVLRTFALYQGFTFVTEPFNLVGWMCAGQIMHNEIFLHPENTPLQNADTLTHELAHRYLDVLRKEIVHDDATEQTVQLVSCRLLKDFDLDVSRFTGAYVYANRCCDKHVIWEFIPPFVEAVYTQMSRDLNEFLTCEDT